MIDTTHIINTYSLRLVSTVLAINSTNCFYVISSPGYDYLYELIGLINTAVNVPDSVKRLYCFCGRHCIC